MKLTGNRYLVRALDVTTGVSLCVFLYIFFAGTIDLDCGLPMPGMGRIGFSCSHIADPFRVLLIALALRFVLGRPDPAGRLRRWGERNRRPLLLGGLIALTAAIPRMYDLGGHSLFPDELTWIDNGRTLIFEVRVREFKSATARLSYPGLVSAALIGSSCVYLGEGGSTFSYALLSPLVAARLPAALIGTLTCLLLYLFARAALGEGAAFWGAVVLALYPEHIGLSRIAHVDSTLTLFFMLSLLCYLMYARRMRIRWKIVSAAFFGLGLLTKIAAVMIVPCLIAWKTILRLRDRRGTMRLIESSDLAWLGIGLGTYLALFTKLWYAPFGPPWIVYGQFLRRVPFSRAVIVTVGAVGSFPWLQILGVLVCAYLLYALVAGRSKSAGWPRWMDLVLPVRAAFIALLVLAFVQVFRTAMINEVFHTAVMTYLGQRGHEKFWMGGTTLAPPYWFYLFMFVVKTPPLMLALMALGLVPLCRAIVRRETGWDACLMSLLAPLVFITAMSFGNKMAARYIDPALPFLCLIAGLGIEGILNALDAAVARGRAPSSFPTWRAVSGVIVAGLCALPLLYIAPYYDIYCSPLMGGPAGVSRMVSTGFGVGTKEAVRYLKANARKGETIFAAGISGEFRFHWERDTPRAAFTPRINRENPSTVDWLVIPLAHKDRSVERESVREAAKLRRAHAISICGVDFVEIYRRDRPSTDAPPGGSAK
ncbi:MAG: glycosyltransferase family 39 protein [Chlamydiota bacterium]